jgi:hypothetical protein
LVTAFGTLVFWRGVQEYWVTIRVYELEATPFGLTFQYFLPRMWAKLVPVLLTLSLALLVFIRAPSEEGRSRVFFAISGPFSLALMQASVCFGTLSYEYHTVSMLGALPGLVIWTEKAGGVSERIKAVTCFAFGLFSIIAFRLFGLTELFDPMRMTGAYAASMLFFYAVCVYVVLDDRSRLWNNAPVPP